MSRFQTLLVLIVLFVMFAPGLALAQDTTPAPEPLPVISIEEAGQLLQVFLTTLIGSAVLTAPITTFLVSVIKRLDKNHAVSSEGWALLVGGVLTVATWLARHFGVEIELNNIFQLVTVIGPGIVALLTTLFGAAVYYQASKVVHAPIVGYERPAKA